MAEIKPQVYKDPRPAEAFEKYHRRVREHDPNWVYEMVRMVFTPMAVVLYRTLPVDAQKVPGSGPVILAPNHFSNLDHFFFGAFLRRQVHFLGKSQIFGKNPVLTYVFNYGGVFPVRRGHHDDEAFITANNLLDRGRVVVIYAEGGRSRTGGLGEPKPGVGRLALESGAPVVPVAIHGSGGARGWKRGRFPQVTVRFGDPIRFEPEPTASRERQYEVSAQIFAPVKAMYEEIEALGGKAVARAAAKHYPAPVRGRPVRWWY